MTLRRIDLDYGKRRRRLGPALLGVGVAAAVVTAAAWVDVAQDALAWERAAAAAERKAAPTAAVDPALARQLQEAGEVIRRLSLPWDQLFRGMEQAASERVALLGIEPDPARREVRLNGEAQAYAEVLRYMSRLEAGTVLTHPRLLNHEMRDEGGQRPVAFAMTARWETGP
jgi:hypothetical protein